MCAFLTLNTDEHGSNFPSVILQLSNLTSLSLANQGIRDVPQGIERLKMLRRFSLDNCPVLETLPGGLGMLPLRYV